MKARRSENPQESLFALQKSSTLMWGLLSMPKIDLHRHISGSIDTQTAINIASKYDIHLPSYVYSELDALLTLRPGKKTLEEYFRPWKILNKLYDCPQAIYELILSVIRNAADDNVLYLELRIGPHGFLGREKFTFEEFAETVATAVADAETLFGTTTRCILGIPRHTFIKIRSKIRNRMFGRIISSIARFWPHCFVGVDLNGVEADSDGQEFDYFFNLARERGLGVTIHAGEVGSESNIKHAIDGIRASRIGHGLAAARDPETLRELSYRRTVLEICPSNYIFQGTVSKVREIPIEIFNNSQVPFVLCSDNPARCKTSLSEELFRTAKAFELSIPDMQNFNSFALGRSFADDRTREKLSSRFQDIVGKQSNARSVNNYASKPWLNRTLASKED